MRTMNKEIKILKQVYVAEDGKEFDTELECIVHEKSIKVPSINDMLWAALLTPSKKRKAEYQDELEALGYKVGKDGAWFIEKGTMWIKKYYDKEKIHTSKGRDIFYGRYYAVSRRRKNGSYTNGHYVTVPKEKINLVGILDATETYNESRYLIGSFYDGHECSGRVHDLYYALNSRKDAKSYLDKAASIRDKDKDKAKEIYEQALKNADRHYNWTVESYTKQYDRAVKDINKILRKEV